MENFIFCAVLCRPNKILRRLLNSEPTLNFCVFVPLACNFIKKEALAHLFSFEFCEIFKDTLFREHF